MSKSVGFNIVLSVNGQEVIVNCKKGIEDLGRAMGTIPSRADNIRNAWVKWSSITTTMQGVYTGIQQITSVMSAYIQKANAASESQVKLSTIMRQRMDASQNEVDSINRVIAKQMELGVVGGTVQRSGLQQLATFATQRSTLETLLPAMNNLLVQQRGLNATSEDAVSIGNLMGKVLQGQTSALKRVGITFSDAEESTLKYGNEQERAATLAQVITNNVGNMNAEMAKTDAGKVKQMSNEFAGLEVKMGQFLSQYQSTIMVVGQVGMAVTGINSIVTGMRALATATGLTTLAMNGFKAAQASFAAMGTLINAAINGTTLSLTELRIAIRGTIMSLGLIGVAYLAASEAFSYLSEKFNLFGDSSDEAKDQMDQLKQSAEELKSSVSSQVGEYEKAIAMCKNFKGDKEDEKKIVDKLNATYGDTLGYFDSVASWYNALIKDSQAYCDQLIIEAQMRQLANQIGENESKKNELIYNPDGTIKKYSKARKTDTEYDTDAYGNVTGTRKIELVGSSDWEKASSRVTAITRQNYFLRAQMNELAGRLSKTVYPVRGNSSPSTSNRSYGQISSRIDQIDKEMKNPNLSKSEYDRLASERKGLAKQKKDLDIQSGKASAPKTHTPKTKHETYKTETQKIDDQLKKLKDQYVNASDNTKDDINSKIQTLERKRAEIELTYKKSEVPKKIVTSNDAEKQLDYLDSLRKLAKKEDIPAIDELIYKTELFQASLNRPDGFKSLTDFDNEINYQQKLLEGASKENVKSIQSQIDKLEELRDQFKEGYDLGSIDDLNATIQRKQNKANRTGNADERKQLQREIKVLQDTVSEMQVDFEPGSIADYSAQLQKLNTKLENVNLTEAERNKLLKERKGLQDSLDDIQAVQDANNVDFSVSPDKDNTDYDSLLERLNKRRADLLKNVSPKANIQMPSLDIMSGKTTDFSIDFSVDGMDDLAEVARLIDRIRNRKKKLDKENTKKGLLDQYGGEMVTAQQNIMGLAKSFQTCGATADTVGSAIAFAGQELQQLGGQGAAAKAGAIASALGQLALGYAYATSEAGKQLGPWGWIAFGLAGMAQLIAMVNTISSFATGGIVPGTSYTGDKVVAHVNSGEMILNARQQARLFAIASGNLTPSLPSIASSSVSPNVSINTTDVSGSGMVSGGKVVLKVKGRDLVGVIENDGKIGKKIGRHTVKLI